MWNRFYRKAYAPILLLFLANCGDTDRYQIEQDKNGRTIRLDKRTGEVVIISGDKLIHPASPDQEAAENLALSTEKDWSSRDFPQLQNVTVKLSTSWADGWMYYKIGVTPAAPILKARGTDRMTRVLTSDWSITVMFNDGAGFKLLDVPILLRALTTIIDDKGIPTDLSANDKVLCSAETYKRLQSWSLGWNFNL